MASPPSTGLAALAAFAERQHGLFTAAQARSVGVGKGVLDRRLRSGDLVAVDYGIYRSVITPTTWHQRLLAACLAGPAVASHRSAAGLWQLPVPDPRPFEVTALRHRRRSSSDVIWHESYLLDDRSVTEVEGIPVTTPGRTVVDLAAVLTPDLLQRVLDDVLRRRLASTDSLAHLLERLGPRRIGAAALRAVLDARAGPAVPESDLETQFELLVRSRGLPAPVPQLHVVTPAGRRLRIDFAYPDAMVGIELLGARFHANPERWAADVDRLGVLAALGWHMLSFTYEQVTRRPDTVVAALERALARSGSAPGGSPVTAELRR